MADDNKPSMLMTLLIEALLTVIAAIVFLFILAWNKD